MRRGEWGGNFTFALLEVGGYVSGWFLREREREGGSWVYGRNLLVAIYPRRCGFVDGLNIRIRQSVVLVEAS